MVAMGHHGGDGSGGRRGHGGGPDGLCSKRGGAELVLVLELRLEDSEGQAQRLLLLGIELAILCIVPYGILFIFMFLRYVVCLANQHLWAVADDR